MTSNAIYIILKINLFPRKCANATHLTLQIDALEIIEEDDIYKKNIAKYFVSQTL